MADEAYKNDEILEATQAMERTSCTFGRYQISLLLETVHTCNLPSHISTVPISRSACVQRHVLWRPVPGSKQVKDLLVSFRMLISSMASRVDSVPQLGKAESPCSPLSRAGGGDDPYPAPRLSGSATGSLPRVSVACLAR
ncbi:hypothetical protein cyc_09093 [Cyclospora cayetanensis]|uniref:Uncharacterized protein n=1 Tax=Cyclospora cayetanensis TaxID=88456 RepID=A0A1D3D6D2_9EIME|nr:hypothetical protein cyc_09093 [Cyclospora cayetanensis]